MDFFTTETEQKNLKPYIENVSKLILKRKLRLQRLAGIDPAEIIVPFNNDETDKLWTESQPWQRTCSHFFGEINNKYPKSKKIQLIKRTNRILPHIV